MPSSRLFEMLAESRARPSGAFRDFQAAADAGNQVATSAYDFQRNKRLDTKLSQLLNDPGYGNMTLRDVADKNSGLLELMKIKDANAPVDVNAPTYDEKGNPAGLVHIGTETKRSKIVQPNNVNIYRGKEFEHKVGQDDINNLQEQLKAIRAQKDKVSILGTPVNQEQFDAMATREKYIVDQLGRLGVREIPPPVPSVPRPSVAPAAAPAQPIAQPAQKVRLTDGKNVYEVDASKAQEKMTKYGLKPAP